jgi:hypothetical protein
MRFPATFSRMFRLSTCVLLTLLAGCDSFVGPTGVDGLSLVPVAEQFTSGGTADVWLRNDANFPVGYNGCLATWERSRGEVWEPLAPLRMCAAVIYTLNSGNRVLLREPLDDWEPGTYRLVLEVNRMDTGSSVRVQSSPFEVRP